MKGDQIGRLGGDSPPAFDRENLEAGDSTTTQRVSRNGRPGLGPGPGPDLSVGRQWVEFRRVRAWLRVRGVGGLRVVDASVFPHMPSGNNNAPTQALAWHAAQLILEDDS